MVFIWPLLSFLWGLDGYHVGLKHSPNIQVLESDAILIGTNMFIIIKSVGALNLVATSYCDLLYVSLLLSWLARLLPTPWASPRTRCDHHFDGVLLEALFLEDLQLVFVNDLLNFGKFKSFVVTQVSWAVVRVKGHDLLLAHHSLMIMLL